jgi:hypothetical protein
MQASLLTIIFIVFFVCLSFSSAIILKSSGKIDLTDNTVFARPNPFSQAIANLTNKPYYNSALGQDIVFPDYWVIRVGN